jgi:alkyl hydroperoxide reductase subunit AhpC
MTNLPDPVIPRDLAPEEVIKWMQFYMNSFANNIKQMAAVLATEQFVESHPKAIVTLQRRVKDMEDFSAMVSRYLEERKRTAP